MWSKEFCLLRQEKLQPVCCDGNDRSKMEPWGVFKGQMEEEFEIETEKER